MTSRKERHKQRRHTERLLDEARLALSDGERALAEKLVARAVDSGPMNPMVWFEAAQVWLELGKAGEAAFALEAALRLAPGFAEAALALEEISERMGRKVPATGASVLDAPPAGGAAPAPPAPAAPLAARTERYDWDAVEKQLAARGCTSLPGLLSADECAGLRALDADGGAFLGAGRRADASGRFLWRWFLAPLQPPLAEVEAELFIRLARSADLWQGRLGRAERFGTSLAAFQDACARAGQILPGARRIECEQGGHVGSARDLPGPIVFPLHALLALSPEGGGSRLVLTDDRPGRRPKSTELRLELGDAAVFCSKERQVEVGGALGLQPVEWGLTPCSRGPAAWVLLPFHLMS